MWLIKDGMKKVFHWPIDWEMLGQTRLTDFVSAGLLKAFERGSICSCKKGSFMSGYSRGPAMTPRPNLAQCQPLREYNPTHVFTGCPWL